MTVHLHSMLLPYEQQLLAARRVARSRKSAQSVAGGDEPRLDPQVQHRAMVERAARDMLSAAAMTGDEAAVVDTAREKSDRTGSSVVHFFSPRETKRHAGQDVAEGLIDRRI